MQPSSLAELFDEALEVSADELTTWLLRRIPDDEQLRQRLEKMVLHQTRAERLLETAGAQKLSPTQMPDSLGEFSILSILGEGGMGIVYKARRQVAQGEQLVAIKVNQYMRDPASQKRFLRERAILAGQNHPYIAQLIDWGSTEDGLVYQVMEFVEGVGIDDFVASAQLSPDKIVTLLVQVCAAIQAIHNNLVIHRDIKPSNILVSADALPKLIDFGIAKQLQGAEQTQVDQLAFTPAYASPEQIRGEGLTVATDVYSLGVLSYRLLLGHLPFDLSDKSWHAMEQHLAHATLSFPKKTPKDLKSILSCALHPDPRQRYANVTAFADDLQAWLAQKPVRAQQTSWHYLLRKFVRRHVAFSVAATTVLLAVFFALGVSIWQNRIAQEELARAEQVTQFLRDLLISNSPGYGASYQLTANATLSDILDVARNRLLSEADNRWDVRVDLLNSIAHSLMWMEKPAAAIDTQRASLELVRTNHTDSLRDQTLLTQTTAWMGEVHENVGEFDLAIEFYEQAFELAQRFDIVATADWLIQQNNFAFTLMRANRWERAHDILQSAIDTLPDVVGAAPNGHMALLQTNMAAIQLERHKPLAVFELLENVESILSKIEPQPYIQYKATRARARLAIYQDDPLTAANHYEKAGTMNGLNFSYAEVEQAMDRLNAARLRVEANQSVASNLARMEAESKLLEPHEEVPEIWPYFVARSVISQQQGNLASSITLMETAQTQAVLAHATTLELDQLRTRLTMLNQSIHDVTDANR